MAEGEGRFSGSRTTWVALAGLLAIHVLLAILLFDPSPFVGGDNAGYMILAEALESGQGYRDIYLPSAPLHGQYPPFYPAILAAARAVGGGLLTFKSLSLVFTTASVAILFLLAGARLGSRWGALAVALPFALSPLLLHYSHWVLSEAPFILLTLVGLWAAERLSDSSRALAVAVIAALLAYLTRAAGLPLLVALALALGWSREWRKLGAFAAGALPTVGGWWLWGRLAASRSTEIYGTTLLLVDPYTPELGYIGPGDLLVRTVNNMRLYSLDVLPDALSGPGAGGGIGLLTLLASLIVLALALVAWGRSVREVRTLELFTLFYTGLIVLWPQVWTDQRFLLPLIPVILLYTVAGAIWCFDFTRVARPRWFLPAFGGLLALLALPDHVRGISANGRCLSLRRLGDDLACYTAPWRPFFQSARWVRDNTSPDAVVVTRKPRLFYLFSGRRGDVYPYSGEDSVVLAFFDEIEADYVVIAGLSGTTARYLMPVVRGYRERFELVQQIGEPAAPAFVLRYRGVQSLDGRAGEGEGEGEGR